MNRLAGKVALALGGIALMLQAALAPARPSPALAGKPCCCKSG